eukprot:CAMPEP_0174901780 /NCGR_PEP_ID=MMETSP0167-20121228/35714_1 /TAXON_ID=38298 /ORGANISM="Rhodella maculata, Strain CCMP736" /LENGTH=83 /DNA_ID=CAMNT_0016143565 /DNA_START=12 /DNA_END=260 /DNA_ORIENTATION=+
MKVSNVHRNRKGATKKNKVRPHGDSDSSSDDSSSDSDSDAGDDPVSRQKRGDAVVRHTHVRHAGCVNRLRTLPQSPSTVATFS